MKRSASRAALRLVHRDQYVPYLLGRLSKGMSSAASVLYRHRLGLGINDSRIIVVLARRPRLTGKELAEDTSLNKSVVSRSLRVLLRKGLVRIMPTDSRLEVQLTAVGRVMHDRVSAVALDREALMLKGFSAGEKRVLIDFLHRMLKNMPLANSYDPLQELANRATQRRRRS
jgi:DNA-binding MarR family transcriptional regulator